jgi:hypothetical protein
VKFVSAAQSFHVALEKAFALPLSYYLEKRGQSAVARQAQQLGPGILNSCHQWAERSDHPDPDQIIVYLSS